VEYNWRFCFTSSEQLAHAFKIGTNDCQSICGQVNRMNGPWVVAKDQQRCSACQLEYSKQSDKKALDKISGA
jgi:hypothetical protein